MKQHITINQYEELSDDAKLKLIAWVSRKTKTTDPITRIYQDMTIGMMIEFLDEHTKDIEYFSIRMGRASDGFAFPKGTLITQMDGVGVEIEDEPVLCDALWEAVNAILTKEEKKA